jgi:hypothetical protein
MLHKQQQTILMQSNLRMNTHSGHEYTIFAPAKLLHNWHEQWPSNKGNLDLNVMGEVGIIYYMGVVGLCFKWYTQKMAL